MNRAIRLLDENKPLDIEFFFAIDGGPPRVRLSLDYGTSLNPLRFTLPLRNVGERNGLGAAIGRSSSLRTLKLWGDINEDNLSIELKDCMEVIFRGMEKNSSIEELQIKPDFMLPDDGTFPTLNLNDAQFKTILKHFTFVGSGRISENQSFMISSFLENVSLECLDMIHVDVDDTSELAFRRVVLACTQVKQLRVYCESASHYAAVASLIGNPRSILCEIVLVEYVNEEELSTIATGLVNNTALKKLELPSYEEDWSPIAKALCDASSIDGIRASNHTLQEMILSLIGSEPLPKMIMACLELNKNENKERVIREKIARYYFVGNFDMSPFANMPVSLLPEVLSLIEGENNKNIQSAIFRMLKCIPELCNVSGRLPGRTDGHKASNSPCNKRLKII